MLSPDSPVPRPRPLGTTAAAALGLAVVVVVVVVVAYAWWATGVQPFTVGAYVAVGIPIVIVTVLALAPGRSWSPWPGPQEPATAPSHGTSAGDAPAPGFTPPDSRSGLGEAVPWIIILVAAVGLEGVALALGGRSAIVPTLSTVVDRGLRWHPVRLLLFCGWLSIGGVPTVRALLRLRHRAV